MLKHGRGKSTPIIYRAPKKDPLSARRTVADRGKGHQGRLASPYDPYCTILECIGQENYSLKLPPSEFPLPTELGRFGARMTWQGMKSHFQSRDSDKSVCAWNSGRQFFFRTQSCSELQEIIK
jgi:hypothetical protein